MSSSIFSKIFKYYACTVAGAGIGYGCGGYVKGLEKRVKNLRAGTKYDISLVDESNICMNYIKHGISFMITCPFTFGVMQIYKKQIDEHNKNVDENSKTNTTQ